MRHLRRLIDALNPTFTPDAEDLTLKARVEEAKKLLRKKKLPRVVLLDLDHTTWIETCDKCMRSPVRRDQSSPYPKVVDKKGNAMTMTNETAGIIRAMYDFSIQMSACSRGKQRDLYEEVAKQMYVDAPENQYTLWSYIQHHAIIQPASKSKLGHVLQIQEMYRAGKSRVYEDLELHEIALFDDDARLLHDIQEREVPLHCIHVDGGQGIKMRHLRRLIDALNPTFTPHAEDLTLKARVEEEKKKVTLKAREVVRLPLKRSQLRTSERSLSRRRSSSKPSG